MMGVDELGVPVDPLTPRDAWAVRMGVAELWGTVPEGLVVSQLGYPVIPEGQRGGDVGRWIPATVSREIVAHPAWWLEDAARLRWEGEDDDDYAGRIHWDLRSRGLSDAEAVVDVLWQELRIDVETDVGWRRVRAWLVGGDDPGLSAMRVPGGESGGPVAAAEKAVALRSQLEARLEDHVVEDLEYWAARSVDATLRFEGSTPEGVCGPLFDALAVGDRDAVAGAVLEVQESLQGAHQCLVTLCGCLEEEEPSAPSTDRIGDLFVAYLDASGRRERRKAADELGAESLARVEEICAAGLAASVRLDERLAVASRLVEAGDVGWPKAAATRGLTVDCVYGPPQATR